MQVQLSKEIPVVLIKLKLQSCFYLKSYSCYYLCTALNLNIAIGFFENGFRDFSLERTCGIVLVPVPELRDTFAGNEE